MIYVRRMILVSLHFFFPSLKNKIVLVFIAYQKSALQTDDFKNEQNIFLINTVRSTNLKKKGLDPKQMLREL